jgi:Uma2 family endonuclease
MQKQEHVQHDGDGSVMRTSGEKASKNNNYLAADAGHFNNPQQNLQHNAKSNHWMKKKGDKSRAGYSSLAPLT